MVVNYRIITIFSSVASAVLCAVSLAFIITALVSYRAEDFFLATKTTDFVALGTCVESITDAQLLTLNYDDHFIKCEGKVDKGNRGKMRNTLAVSVHGLYYTLFNPDSMVKDYVGSAPPTYFVHDIAPALAAVTSAVVTATIGNAPAEIQALIESQATFDGRTPEGVNFTQAYLALHYVAEQKVPTSCDEIYGINSSDIPLNEFGEVEFIENLRLGRKDGPIKIKKTWPLRDIVVDCNDYPNPTPGTYPIDVIDDMGDPIPLGRRQKALLHAHCNAQFLFASVGTISNAGTFTVPLPGIDAGPGFLPYPQASGFNSTSTYTMKARMYLGQRFGLSIFAYVPMVLTTCFLLADAVVFFLAEITMPEILADMQKFTPTRLAYIRDSLVIAATSKTSRRKRLSVGFLAVILSFIFYGIFIAGPWGFFYTNMPRPICEEGAPDHASPTFGLWKGTHGGWKSDWDATWYDLAAIFTQLFVLILLPITTTGMGRDVNKALGNGDKAAGRLYAKQVAVATQLVHNKQEYRQMMTGVMNILVLGIVVLLAGQASSGARFGMAWAEGVVAQEVDEDGVLIFDEIQLSEVVYDQTIATLAIVVACGLIFGAVIQRHLFGGVGCLSGLAFFAWLGLVVVFALPLLVYASIRSIFHHDAANNDCAIFPRSSHEFENNLCTSRYWTFLIGGGIFLFGVLSITALGLKNAIPAILKTRQKANVPYNAGGRAKAPKKGSKFFREGPSANVATPLYDGVDEAQEMALGGYRSTDDFFNFKTKIGNSTIANTNEFLYAPRMNTPSAR